MPELDTEAHQLWRAVADLAEGELADAPHWCLVGGLMVQLFAFEHGGTARPTTDIDVLADARTRPSATEQVAMKLKQRGAELRHPARDGTAYQFDVDGQLVEVLGPEGLRRPARTLGKFKTVAIPGGTQALKRAEEIRLVIGDGRGVTLRRPTLPGAILMKARSLPKHSDPESQREDLIALLSFLPDPRATHQELSRTERDWLRKVRNRLELEDPRLADRFSETTLRLARDAYELLVS